MKHLERLKKLFNLAQRLEWVQKDPFSKFKLKFTRVEREFLDECELKQIVDFETGKSTLVKTRDGFIFSCYTGLSYIDVKHLTANHIVRGIDGNQ